MDLAPLLTRRAELDQLARKLVKARRVAFDTESDSLYHYREKVCLIQIATDEGLWLLDPLAIRDLSPLAPVFASEKIEKVLHGADYDITCLKRDFAFQMANLFDTMIAAQFLGRKGWGLGALAQSELGITLQKHSQRKDWSRRPIPQTMRSYAQEDVLHLPAIRDRLAAELDACGRMAWLREECQILCDRPPGGCNHTPNGFLRVKGARTLTPRELGVLSVAYRLRDRWARKLDRPPFKVLGNGTLFEIARQKPQNEKALLAIKGVTDYVLGRYGEDLLTAVVRGMELPEDKLPKFPKPIQRPKVPGMLGRIERLRAWRKGEARRRKIDEGVLLSQNLILALARAAPKTREELAGVQGLRAWRIDAFGDELLRAVQAASGPRASARAAANPNEKRGSGT